MLHDDLALDDLIREAAPVRNSDLDLPGIQAAVARMATETTRSAPDTGRARAVSVRRRGLRRLAPVTVAAALLVGSVTGLASVTGFPLWSGWFDSPSSSESIAGEEYVSVTSPQFGAAFDLAATAYPLPAGKTYRRLRLGVIRTGGLKQLTGLRGEMAMTSGCAWSTAWLDADRRHDVRARHLAESALSRIAASPDLAAIDGGGIVAAARTRAAAARAGDAAPLERYRSSVNCGGEG